MTIQTPHDFGGVLNHLKQRENISNSLATSAEKTSPWSNEENREKIFRMQSHVISELHRFLLFTHFFRLVFFIVRVS